MKIKRFLTTAVSALLIGALLGGCNASMKTAKVAGKFGEALKNQPVTSATAEISAGVSTTTQGKTQEAKFRTVVRSKTDWDAERSYSDIETNMGLGELSLKQTMQCYTSGESGESVRYVHVDSADTWLRLENQKRAVDIDPELILMLLDKVAKDTTLEVQENTVSGSGTYLLGLVFNAEDIRKFAESADIHVPEEFQAVDLSGVSVPITLEIEDKTYLPLSLQIQLKGINQPVTEALAKYFASGKALEKKDIHVNDISLLITNFAYGPQDIPMLPKGAAENALDMEIVKEIQNS